MQIEHDLAINDRNLERRRCEVMQVRGVVVR